MADQCATKFVNKINELIVESSEVIEKLLSQFEKIVQEHDNEEVKTILCKWRIKTNGNEVASDVYIIKEHLKAAFEVAETFSNIKKRCDRLSKNTE
jgi:hypothetical protein